MTFKSAYLKLTLFYVLIIMVISISFSAVLYQISSNELDRGLDRQERTIRDIPQEFQLQQPSFQPDFEKIRLDQLEESSQRLRLNLIYFNLLIFVLSSLLSYFFARRTLTPIKEMVEAQNRFTADASHELKTPLTAMRSEIEVNLRDKKLGLKESKKLLASNLEEINKLETLSNALLMLAKYQEELKLDFKKVELSQLIVEAYEKVEKLAEAKSIKFENNFEKIYVQGERQSLIELFVILLDNAVKYSPANSKISINLSSNKKWAEAKIKDSGIGIKASDLPHIFDRFYRADHSRNKEKADGYGLGLSIAKRIIKLHKGTIKAKSKPGDGSEFIIELPKF